MGKTEIIWINEIIIPRNYSCLVFLSLLPPNVSFFRIRYRYRDIVSSLVLNNMWYAWSLQFIIIVNQSSSSISVVRNENINAELLKICLFPFYFLTSCQRKSFAINQLLCEKDSPRDASLITTILLSSSLRSTVIYLTYHHNLQLFLPYDLIQ